MSAVPIKSTKKFRHPSWKIGELQDTWNPFLCDSTLHESRTNLHEDDWIAIKEALFLGHSSVIQKPCMNNSKTLMKHFFTFGSHQGFNRWRFFLQRAWFVMQVLFLHPCHDCKTRREKNHCSLSRRYGNVEAATFYFEEVENGPQSCALGESFRRILQWVTQSFRWIWCATAVFLQL